MTFVKYFSAVRQIIFLKFQSGRWTVVGLVSWGIGCASDLPGVYVDVAHYRDWINAN